ncbi:acyl dehydratase [Rhodococcus sp. 06-156-3C]|uniref:acyl dehydratase n=1 Tax=Nocardiaceae TaxID=85025 RepID=UPI000522F908|nr:MULTISPECIES: acyl dehydratase [Rhodococcus]OZD11624.1 acyl dehydratase [Rhodococcus sp. 06-156-4C]OZD15466.1 acyl dehydratase [Rhodococcus sp. 06-156-4a]OZD23632.1 acyl dehydratase [Rhodococcus sp. 06-156-3C]OZD27296.1 acyl dehydratase [Rhodococcus sp. 06-156-3b]OZD31308.1 acyl dehydratase [Rhodococcus sp. 06-156-3]
MTVSGRECVRSPYFDELTVGQVFDTAPAVTLSDGLQAVHGAIVGNRHSLSLDHELARTVTGGAVANPALVWDISIGQSTIATQHVKANLFYRGLFLHRLPMIGDTLRTTTVIEALRENSGRSGRPPTGLAVLHITTVDQHGCTVLDYRRCAMLMLAPGAPPTGFSDEIDRSQHSDGVVDPFTSVAGWNLGAFPRLPRTLKVGDELEVLGGDIVSSAPELARSTGNLARVHHDSVAGGGTRLVYGGHSIGIAFHHLCQALPGLITVAGWRACDHVAPVHEGDFLTSSVTVESIVTNESGFDAMDLLISTTRRAPGGDSEEVLTWRPTVIV